MDECKNCFYFAMIGSDKEPRCYYDEWEHDEWEAECNNPYDNDDIFGYDDFTDDYYEGWD